MSDGHRFEKSVADYASGALVLVRTRIREHREKTGAPPRQLVLHPAIVDRLFTEFAAEHGLPKPPVRLMTGGNQGAFEGTRFSICPCGEPHGEDQLIDQLGNVEPL